MSTNQPQLDGSSSSVVAVGYGRNFFHNMGSATTISSLEHQTIDEITSNSVQAFELHSDSSNKRPPWEEEDDPLVDVQCTITSSCFLTKGGKLYTCGTLHGIVLPTLTKIIIALPLKCVQIATGRHFCLARMEGGLAVCSWGAGHFGQLGLGGDSLPFVDHPTVIEALLPHVVGSPIATVAAGYWHSMAVTQAGLVFAFGCNRNGQCAAKQFKEPPTVCTPQLVNFDSTTSSTIKATTTTSSATSTSSSSSTTSSANARPVKIERIAAGRSHSVALDQSGQVYCWGANQYGQCGLILRRRGGIPQARHVEALARVRIVRIAAGDAHTLALTGGGRVFAWGGGFEGQLGTGCHVFMNPKPKLVGDLDFLAIEAGREWKTMQKEQDDATKTLDSSHGQLDFHSTSQGSTHPLSSVPRIISIHAKGNSSVAISNAGHVYAWGCNDVGNLGLPQPDPATLTYVDPGLSIHKTSTLRTVHTFSFDSSHNVFLPQRLDSIRHLHITDVAMSPTFLWCLGTKRHGMDDPKIGRTLYEIQEAKRQKSILHVHYERILKTVDTAVSNDPPPSTVEPLREISKVPELSKQDNKNTIQLHGELDPVLVEAGLEDKDDDAAAGDIEQKSKEGSTSQHLIVESTSRISTSTGEGKMMKRLFSPQKLVRALVRRTSFRSSKSDTHQQQDDKV
jgi:alpha-tubulin suppressor-like RCC1 family protein